MTRDEFNICVRRISRMMYMFAYRFLKDREEAEDAVQEVFIRMWNMGQKLDTYDSVEALATTMTRNYCIDRLRKQKMSLQLNEAIHDRQSGFSPHEIMELAESDNIIRNIINELPELYGSLIKLHDIEGFSYEEISEKLGQNVNTLRVTISRARTMIRDNYKKYFNEKRGIGKPAGKVL